LFRDIEDVDDSTTIATNALVFYVQFTFLSVLAPLGYFPGTNDDTSELPPHRMCRAPKSIAFVGVEIAHHVTVVSSMTSCVDVSLDVLITAIRRAADVRRDTDRLRVRRARHADDSSGAWMLLSQPGE
jgi:hypothetical protein